MAEVIDFEDLVSRAVSVLDIPSVQQLVRLQYAHILVDEYQVRGVV